MCNLQFAIFSAVEAGDMSGETTDRLIQGMAFEGDFRILAAQTTDLVRDARRRADLSPVAAIALGRAMTGALLLARLLQKDARNQYVTLRFDGGGPLGLVVAEATVAGSVRGFVANPLVDQPNLDVGAAVGSEGTLTVVRGGTPQGRPYTSQVRLATGSIARDLALFLSRSEQIHSAVLLGVHVGPEGIGAAGGVVVQSFPHASDESIASMEQRILETPPLSALVRKLPIEDVVGEMFRGTGYKALDPSFDVALRYHCPCTRERALAPFALFAREEIDDMIEKDGGADATCQFCGVEYHFGADELERVRRRDEDREARGEA